MGPMRIRLAQWWLMANTLPGASCRLIPRILPKVDPLSIGAESHQATRKKLTLTTLFFTAIRQFSTPLNEESDCSNLETLLRDRVKDTTCRRFC